MKKFTIGLVLMFGIYLWVPVFSQNNPSKNVGEQVNTRIDNIDYWFRMAQKGLVPFDPPIPASAAEDKGTMITSDVFNQNSPDITIWSAANQTQSENSVFIDPDNNMSILNSNNSTYWTGSTVTSIYGSDYLFSSNAGQSWTGSINGAGGSNSGDPTTAISISGRNYVGYITNAAGQGVAWSDNGTTWNPVVVSTLVNPVTNDLLDKNHLWIDNKVGSSYQGYVYDAWTRFNASHVNNTDIEFSRSTNNGVSWSTPLNISNAIAAGSHNQGVNIQTGPAGQVYAVWTIYDTWGPTYNENAIGFAKSTNGGSSFTAATRIHNNIKGIRGWVSPANATGKNMRVNSFPAMAVDISSGPYSGYIYVVWANIGVPGTNTGTNVSVYCMRSTNAGVSWGTPVRVNQGSSADGYASFIPWITCDPVTGKLFCIFYDDRNLGTTSSACETWVAYSEDAGVTWSDFRVSDVSFTPAPMPGLATGYMGDYLGISARDGRVYPVWSDNRSGRVLAYISPLDVGGNCIASGGCDEYISNVNIGSINNSSTCNGYSDYRGLSTNIPVNGSAAITVTNGNPVYSPDQCGIWVDWNRDGDFADANETITNTLSGVGPYSATITPPATATPGTCTMRVRITYTGTVDPCGTTSFGEVEDYTLNLTAAVPNYWTGAFNYYWHNAANWSLGHIPYATEDVIMTTAGYHPPSVDFYSEECKSLTINSGAGLIIAGYTLTLNGDLNINGNLTMNNAAGIIYAKGNWNNYVGAAGFAAGPGKVVFNGGAYHQYCSNETFNILEVNKPSGGAFRMNGTNVVCAQYDWTAGAIDVLTGSFTANDLADNGIFGSYYTNPGGTINLHQDASQYADLDGNLYFSGGGNINVYGGNGDSFWPYLANASITMSGGVLDFKDIGIYVNNTPTYSLTTNITGGTIRTAGGYSGNRADFAPTAGEFEFYGSGDVYIYQSNGSTLYNVTINKAGKSGSDGSLSPVNPPVIDERSGVKLSGGGKANNVTLGSYFSFLNSLTITSGSFTLGGFTASIYHHCYVSGTLIMNNPADAFNLGLAGGDYLEIMSGGQANLTNGVMNLISWLWVHSGGVINAAPPHSVYFNASVAGGFEADSPGNTLGDVIINKGSTNNFYLFTYGDPVTVAGDLTVNAGNIFDMQNFSLHVNGTITDFPTSTIYVYNGPGKIQNENSPPVTKVSASNQMQTTESIIPQGSPTDVGNLTIDGAYTINGLLDVGDGSALVHGAFSIASTGNLNITSGSFICDAPLFAKGWEYINGHLGLTSGLFEISHNSIQFSSTGTSTISGGIIRSGEAFAAQNSGNFQPTGGTVEIVGVGSNTIYCSNGNYFYNLLINRDPAAASYFYTNITVNNNLTVNSGILTLNGLTANVSGGVTISGGNLVVNSNANLLLAGGTALNVNSGGKLSVIGAVGTPGKVSRISTGYYSFNVLNGGTIAAQYGTFEYMDYIGINLQPGCLVDPANSFHNCTFQYQNPIASSSLFTIGGPLVFTANNASFPVNTGANTFNVWKYDDAGDISFYNATGSFAGPNFEYDPYNHVQWTVDPYNVSLTVFLEGPFNTSTNLMNTTLNSILPLSQPYGVAPPGNPNPDWLYTGTENVGSIPSASIVDWVEVELRDATTAAGAVPGRVIGRKAAFLLNNGAVVGLDGASPLNFNAYVSNNLYAVVWHRSHLGVLSANPLTPISGGYSYNFSSGSGQAYGGSTSQKLLGGGKYGMKSGDGTGNGMVEISDKTSVWTVQTGKTGYREGDYNMNRQVSNQDKDDKWLPNLGSGSFIPE